MSSLLIAYRNLVGEKGRLLITIGGVAFSVTLILVLVGLYQGWSRQMTKFLGNIDADIWVGQKGSRDLSHTLSILPAGLEDQLKKVEGVESATPFVGRQTSFEINNKETHLYLIALDESKKIKPYKIIRGQSSVSQGEIIVDKTLADAENLNLGDQIKIANRQLKIVGISAGGNLLVYTYALANEQDVREIFDFQNFNNYYLIKATDRQLAKDNLSKSFPDLAIVSREKFLENNASLVKETFLPIIGVLVIIALAIGIAVIGLTIFTATIEKAREFGVLKAIGFGNWSIFAIALYQSVIAGIVGFLLGNLIVLGVVKLATSVTSSFIYEVSQREILILLIVTLAMSIIASFIPLKRIISIDPASVFKA